MSDRYQEALAFLYNRLNYERSGMPRSATELRISRTRHLLNAIGDPQRSYPIVHIAGTKGKGSTSAMIAAALTASGTRTGLFTSPHLHTLEERFQIDGVPIAPECLTELADHLRPVVAALEARDPHLAGSPFTFFELTTALGLLYFARQRAGAVVLEVGLGGRLDSTNCVRPAVSVITSISYDHTRILGSTLTAIATEKAGILKRDGRAVIGTRGAEARAAIQQIAAQRRSRAYWIDSDFRETYEPPATPVRSPTAGVLRVETWRRQWGPLAVPLLGRHQAMNASTALAALDAWADAGLGAIDEADVRRGWARLRLPARVEVLGESPWLVIDGAHNVVSAEALVETLDHHFPDVPRILVFGSSRDKDYAGQLAVLLPRFERTIVTQFVGNPRAVPADELLNLARSLGPYQVDASPEPASALTLARSVTVPHGLICVTGSLFLAAEARAVALGLPGVEQPSVLI